MKKTVKTLLMLCAVTLLILPMLVSCGKCKHKESEWQDDVAATCSVAGVRVKVCLECSEVLESEEYEISHQFVDGACTYCGVAQYGSAYLEYREITLDGEQGYEVIGRGNSTAIRVEIPSMRNGKPVLSVAARAFAGNKTMVAIHFGQNVKQIGEQAFSGCVALTTVTFHAQSELAYMGKSVFLNCEKLTAFAVPKGLCEIPSETFKGCVALSELSLHSDITVIGDEALEGCEALTYFEENGAKYLGASDAPHLFLAGMTDKTVTAFAVPSDTRIIGTAAFLGCTSLASITLPDGLLALSPYALGACTSLTSITLPSTLNSIGTAAFAECAALTSITIPSGVEHIGEKAFYKCTLLSSIALPAAVKSVGEFAFLQTGLTYTVSDGGKYLGNPDNPYLVLVDTVAGITSLTVHEDTRVVANGALADADAEQITSVTLGANVITLGAGAFLGCTELEELIFAPSEDWKIATVYGVNPISIVVRDSSVTASAIVGVHKNDYWYR